MRFRTSSPSNCSRRRKELIFMRRYEQESKRARRTRWCAPFPLRWQKIGRSRRTLPPSANWCGAANFSNSCADGLSARRKAPAAALTTVRNALRKPFTANHPQKYPRRIAARASRFRAQRALQKFSKAPAGNPFERRFAQRIVAAGQAHCNAIHFVFANRREKAVRKFIRKSRIVAPAHGDDFLSRAAQFGKVRHRADGRPEIANLLFGNLRAQRLPNVNGGQAVCDDVSKITGNVQQGRSTNQRLVRSGDAGNARAEADAHNSERAVAARREPAQTAARVANRLAIGLQREPDVRTDDVVGAWMARNRAPVVIRQTQPQRGDAEAIEPAAKLHVRSVVRVPLRQNNNCRAASGRRKKSRVDAIVFRPGRLDGAGKFQFLAPGRAIFRRPRNEVGGRFTGEPLIAARDRFLHEIGEKRAGIFFVRVAADVFEAPGKGQRAPVGLSGPAPVLVAPDFLFEPAHDSSSPGKIEADHILTGSAGKAPGSRRSGPSDSE